MFARFTVRARRVMERAEDEARRFNHEYIGTEHILLALVGIETGVAAAVLARLGVTADRLIREVEKIVLHGPDGGQPITGRLPHTPWTKKATEAAIDEAREHGNSAVDTGHLLLGLSRAEEGVASQILRNFGLTFDKLRAEVRKGSPELVGDPVTPPEPPRRPPSDPQARAVYDLIMGARRRKEACIEAEDFEQAARCRDEEMTLRHELARLLDRPDR